MNTPEYKSTAERLKGWVAYPTSLFSGYGKAEGKINVIVIPCENLVKAADFVRLTIVKTITLDAKAYDHDPTNDFDPEIYYVTYGDYDEFYTHYENKGW